MCWGFFYWSIEMDLTIIKNELTMSSREIAELCGKEHKNVMADIREISDQIGRLIFEQSSYINSQNKTQPMYLLNKKNTLLLVSGYSVILRQKIIDRLEELENQQSKPTLPQTYVEALTQLLAVAKENEALQIENKQVKSINNALMHINKNFTTTELAKELHMKSAKILNELLRDKGIQYKQNGTWLLYSKYTDMDLVTTKQAFTETNHSYYLQKWTQKGRQFVLALFDKEVN